MQKSQKKASILAPQPQQRPRKEPERYSPKEVPEDDYDSAEYESEEEPLTQEKYESDPEAEEDPDFDPDDEESEEEEIEPYTQIISKGGKQFVQVIWGDQVIEEREVKPKSKPKSKGEPARESGQADQKTATTSEDSKKAAESVQSVSKQ